MGWIKSLHDYKFWPAVGRIDNVFGDRNPVCSCVGGGIILNHGWTRMNADNVVQRASACLNAS
jgi:hypothetical protein